MKSIKIAGSIFLLVWGLLCQASPLTRGYTIKGNFSGLKDGTLLELIPTATHHDEKAIAIAKVSGGTFQFKGTLPGPRFFMITVKGYNGGCRVMVDHTNITISGKGSLQKVSGNSSFTVKDLKIKGSPVHDLYLKKIAPREALEGDYAAINKKSEVIRKKIEQARKENDSLRIDSLLSTEAYKIFEQEEVAFFSKVHNTSIDLIKGNKDSWWGPFMMLHIMSYFTPEDKPVFDLFSAAAKNSYYGKLLQQELFPKGFLGEKAPLVDAKAQDNTIADISKLVAGHTYTVVDFWASWCAPCRKALPKVKELYQEFGRKGLQIVSISIDKNEVDWTKAEKEEQLKWPSFIDNGKTAEAWKVKTIPAIFLLDENGMVVGDHLTLDQLRAKLK